MELIYLYSGIGIFAIIASAFVSYKAAQEKRNNLLTAQQNMKTR